MWYFPWTIQHMITSEDCHGLTESTKLRTFLIKQDTSPLCDCPNAMMISEYSSTFSQIFMSPLYKCTYKPAPIWQYVLSQLWFTDALVSWYEELREMSNAPVFFLLPQPAQRWEDVRLWNRTDREDANYFAARTWTDKIRILKDNPSHCVQSWREDVRRASKKKETVCSNGKGSVLLWARVDVNEPL